MKSSILIVGDHLKIRPDLRGTLGADFAVNTCETIKAAEKALACRGYALVIVEAHLQDGSGLDLLQAIRAIEAKRRPRVIVLSEDTSTTSRMRSLRAGADVHVGKPYDSAYVLGRAREIVQPETKQGGHPAGERSALVARKVLLITNSPIYVETLAEVLRQDHLDVVVVGSGEEALARLENEPVDALIVDFLLPGIDALETCRRVRRSPERKLTPIMMLTANPDARSKWECLRAGADELVVKTPDLEPIRARLRALFHRESDGRELRASEHAGQENNGPWRAQSDVPPGCLVFRAVVEAGISRIIGPRTMARVCSRAGIDPRTSSAADVVRALPALREALGIFLLPGQVEEHIAAVTAFTREVGALHQDTHSAPASPGASFAQDGEAAIRLNQRSSLSPQKPVEMTQPPMRGSSSVVLRGFGAATDIDEVKRAQAQTESMLEGVSIGVALCDANLCYTNVNKAFAALDGVPREAHLGRRLDEVGPAMAATFAPLLQHAPDAGEPIKHIELSGPTNGSPGVRRRWRASYYPVKIEEHVVGVMILGVDITEQERAERADAILARAMASLSASLDINVILNNLARVIVPDLADLCIVFLGGGSEVVRVATVAHVDPTQAELIRTLCERYPHPPDAPHGYQYVLRTGKPDIVPVMTDDVLASVACNEEHLRLLRELRSTSGVVVPLTASGRVLGAMMLLSWDSGHRFDPFDVPIAEEIGRRLAVAIEHAEDFEAAKRERSRAEEANRLKDEFLTMVSHELRTPLNAVLGWTRMLREGKVDAARAAKALAMIERNTLAQSQLIEDLLDVGRIVAGKLRLTICPVNMPLVIAAAVESMRPAAEAREIVLQEEIDPEATPIMGDAGRLQQIAFNLINNAVKFTPRKGLVKVILRRSDRYIEIAIEDTGRGISPNFLPHIFERFRQAETGVHRSKGGLGLGLAIVKRLVELHGGTIDARSDGEGRGAALTVQLPIGPLRIALDSADAAARPSWPPSDCLTFEAPPELEGLFVLVIDDEPDAVHVLRSALEQSKARVITATSAAEAMLIVEGSRPDVILADIAMPGEDGHAFVRRLRAMPKERGGRTPAVALTAYGGAEAQERALQSGFDRYVVKPADPSELVLTLAGAAGR